MTLPPRKCDLCGATDLVAVKPGSIEVQASPGHVAVAGVCDRAWCARCWPSAWTRPERSAR